MHTGAQRAGSQASRTVHLALSPQEDFRGIIHRLDAVVLPPTRASAGNIRFAILELINNSIRAHREKGETRDIEVAFTLADGRLEVTVRDFGGGFDPGRLPFDVSADPGNVNLRSAPFEEYQKRNGYKRFGMGLYVAKKTFDDFQLQFVDCDGNHVPWEKDRVVGTHIFLSAAVHAGSASGVAAP